MGDTPVWIDNACVLLWAFLFNLTILLFGGGGTVTQQKVDEAGLWNDCTFLLDKIISRFDISRK